MSELAFLPALVQAELIRRKEVSPVELVSTYLDRIAALDPTLNSYVTVAADRALEEARRAEAALGDDDLPPFHGVPISIKDLTETEGLRTTFSCKAFADYVPDMDASYVRRIKGAGFIILGKTNTPEFGTVPVTESELNGVCRNPWDTERTPGGSSGGAAAALAAGLCPMAQGSDGGGSIRIPASCCGVFGVKPARGRVSNAPRLGESLAGLATSGPLARTVADAAALLDVMEGYEAGDPYWAPPPKRPFAQEVGAAPGRLRIAVTSAAPNFSEVDPRCVDATEDAAELLQSLGHDVDEAAPDWARAEMLPMFLRIWQAGYAAHQTEPSQLEPLNRVLAEGALQTSSIEYVEAEIGISQYARRVVALWDDYDLLLTPTLALPPVPVGWNFEPEDPWAQFARAGEFVPFTPPLNITGQPAVSVPLHWTEEGLPIGVQLVGPPAGEAVLLRISAQLEEARPWADRRPPGS